MSFRFKQFEIQDDKCAMKVGTDGVLLGCWVRPNPDPARFDCPPDTLRLKGREFRILDIGTGSGLIARMLMQRCPEAIVDAIDIDEAAVEQAKENGVNAFLSSLQEWPNIKSKISNIKYDIVVSNPPYFQNSLKNPDAGRKTARHTDTLSYAELIQHSARLLCKNGQLALILPAEAEAEVRQLAATEDLFPTHITRVFSKESKPARRVLMAFVKGVRGLEVRGLEEDTLILENEKGGRSLQYQELTKDFYL